MPRTIEVVKNRKYHPRERRVKSPKYHWQGVVFSIPSLRSKGGHRGPPYRFEWILSLKNLGARECDGEFSGIAITDDLSSPKRLVEQLQPND